MSKCYITWIMLLYCILCSKCPSHLENVFEHFSGFHSVRNLKALLKINTNFQRVHTLPLCVSSIWKEFLLLISTKYIYHFSWRFCLFYKILEVCGDDNLFYWSLLSFFPHVPSPSVVFVSLPLRYPWISQFVSIMQGRPFFNNFSYWIKKKKRCQSTSMQVACSEEFLCLLKCLWL